MSALSIHQNAPLIRPEPRVEINIRPAEPGSRDFEFIDDLQKQHTKMLGFMHRKTLENYIAGGDVLIAETPAPTAPDGSALPAVRGIPLGYIIGRDRYFKREDVGILYQLVVGPTKRRKLIGAMLVQAMFERAAYGCKLFCLWCAQDLEANHFWESIGFVPLAFRTGSPGNGRNKAPRIHIFWQKRIREGDTGPGSTPWWIPSLTNGGAIREDRLVIPIPPGTHWSDAKPLVLPGVDPLLPAGDEDESADSADDQPPRRRKQRKAKLTAEQKRSSHKGGLWFAPSGSDAAPDEQKPRPRKARPKRKYHPKYVAAARELCARYLEEVHTGRLLPEAGAAGKYDVSRQIAAAPDQGITAEITEGREGVRLLDAA